jgi:DNA polymerase-3 subunit alpha
MGLFDGGSDAAATPPPLRQVPPWPVDDTLQREREAIGLFITGHPLDRYERDLRRFTTLSIGELRTKGLQLRPSAPDRPGREARPKVKLGGVVHGVKLRNNKRGDRYATFSLEDRQGVVEAIAWADVYRRFESLIAPGTAVVVEASLEVSTERCQIIVQEMTPLAEAREQAIRQLHVRVPLDQVDKQDLDRLRDVLTGHPGACEAFLHLERPDGMEMVVALPKSIRVAASDDVVDAVERLLGSGVTSFR